jgi:hypothetical protein
MAEWSDVSAIAASFPEVEESLQGRPTWRVRGKLFAWMARERDGGGLAVRVDGDEKQLILDSNPDVYFSSPHYGGYPGVQIRLELIDRDELLARLEDAWLIQAPKRLCSRVRRELRGRRTRELTARSLEAASRTLHRHRTNNRRRRLRPPYPFTTEEEPFVAAKPKKGSGPNPSAGTSPGGARLPSVKVKKKKQKKTSRGK